MPGICDSALARLFALRSHLPRPFLSSPGCSRLLDSAEAKDEAVGLVNYRCFDFGGDSPALMLWASIRFGRSSEARDSSPILLRIASPPTQRRKSKTRTDPKMNSRKLTNIVKGALADLLVLWFSLFGVQRGTGEYTKLMTPAKATTVKRNPSEVKRTLLQIIDRKGKINPKLAKSAGSSCGCSTAAPQGFRGFGGFKACFAAAWKDKGVSIAGPADVRRRLFSAATRLVCAVCVCVGVARMDCSRSGTVLRVATVFSYTEASLRPTLKARRATGQRIHSTCHCRG